ncbi:MAG: tetratricopeptide repeat protein [Treponema sp.]|nr:tetratricopeptide repeat protein [Treponema sp.]
MIERADTLNNQAILLAKDGQFSDAIACLRRAIHIDRNNSLVWYNLGITYRDAGDMMEALTALRNAFRISPQKEDVVESLSVLLLNMHMIDEAFKVCQDGLDFHPMSERLWNLMGVLQFNNDDYAAAAENFEMAVTINPYYSDALYNLRDAYSELKNVKAAVIINERIQELEGKNKK